MGGAYAFMCRHQFELDVAYCNRMKGCLEKGAASARTPDQCGRQPIYEKGIGPDPWPAFDEGQDAYSDWP
jgi:hypothetical protein